jgi:sugar lactone lactonase YvrE
MEAVADTPAVFAECPVWLPGPQCLCWVDCAAGRLFALDWQSRRRRVVLERPGVLFAGLVRHDAARLVLLAGDGAFLVSLDGATAPLPLPSGVDAGLFNDAKCDAAGRLWFGRVRSGPGLTDGALLRLGGGKATEIAAGLGIPNGPALDGTRACFADSLAGRIEAIDLDAEGRPGPRRLLHRSAEGEGQPDGMAFDAAGTLFVALHHGGALLRLGRSGSGERIAVPAPDPTSVAFGGPDLRTLFVTVANGPWPADRRRPRLPPPPDPRRPSLYTLRMARPGREEPDCTAFAAPIEEETPS